MLSNDELESILAKIKFHGSVFPENLSVSLKEHTLKLGHSYGIVPNRTAVYLKIRYKAENADCIGYKRPHPEFIHPEGSIKIFPRHRANTTAFLRFVRSCVLRALVHEMDETLRYNNEYIVDPHPERKAR